MISNNEIAHEGARPVAVSFNGASYAWTTRPEAEFFNSLCPVGTPEFPNIPGLHPSQHELLQRSCRRGFRWVQDLWDARGIDRCRLSQAEGLVLAVIYRKTISFGKLLEKLPQRVMMTGDLAIGDFGNPRLPSTGLDSSAVNRGIRLLVSKGLIGKFPASTHPRFGTSIVYCPLPMNEMLQAYWTGIELSAIEFFPGKTYEAPLEALYDLFNVNLRGLAAQNAVANQPARRRQPAREERTSPAA